MIIRQGDISFHKVDNLPRCKEGEDNIIARGEFTGHHHALMTKEKTPKKVLLKGDDMYLSISKDDVITHQEHKDLVLPVGDYVVKREREFDPFQERINEVKD